MFKKRICVDLDGVLNMYDGWKGEEHFPDPRPGAREFLEALNQKYEVVILTTRFPPDTKQWMDKHNLPFFTITSTKPPAIVYIDDRAICFEGSFDGMLERVENFKAHWESI